MQASAEKFDDSEKECCTEILLQQLRDCNILDNIDASKRKAWNKNCCEMEFHDSSLKTGDFLKTTTTMETTDGDSKNPLLLSLLMLQVDPKNIPRSIYSTLHIQDQVNEYRRKNRLPPLQLRKNLLTIDDGEGIENENNISIIAKKFSQGADLQLSYETDINKVEISDEPSKFTMNPFSEFELQNSDESIVDISSQINDSIEGFGQIFKKDLEATNEGFVLNDQFGTKEAQFERLILTQNKIASSRPAKSSEYTTKIIPLGDEQSSTGRARNPLRQYPTNINVCALTKSISESEISVLSVPHIAAEENTN
uniref:Uncharacterized protein n=1 Tax=Glossina brevipalpis TaxID=37001 RepID=A0A1A9WZK6_9MUSC